MPDFDKDLKPIIKETESVDLQPNARAVEDSPLRVGGGSNPNLSGTPSVFDELAQLSSRAKSNTVRPFVSDATLQANQRYDTFNPTIENQEDFAAYGQSTAEKAVNGILKGTNLAATTIAGGFAMLGGAVQWALPGGKFSDIWDNPVMQGLDKWNTKVDNELLPNYYTQAEKDAAWYSTDNWMTANFLFDKVIKNAGFAVGAMVSGNIANAGLLRFGAAIGRAASARAVAAEASQAFKLFTPLLRNTSRAFSAAKNVEAATILEGQISSIADLAAKESAIGAIAKTTNQFANIGDKVRRSAVAAYSSAGEASFEALQTSKEFRNNLIEEFKTNNGGLEPQGQDLEDINVAAERVGKTSFIGNLALLGVTEYYQLPKLLGSSYAPSRKVANSLLGEVGDITVEGGVYAAAKSATKFGKLYDKVGGVTKYVFDPKEAAQENLQYALQVGTQNYFNKAYRTNEADALVDGMLYGLVGKNSEGKDVGSLVSKEGIEGAVIGGLTGGVMQARGTFQESRAIKNNTAKFLEQLNNAPEFKAAFIDRMNSINRSVILQEQQQQAIIQGDKLEAKDLDADQMHNYLATRIKYGRFDMVMGDINDLRIAASTEAGLADLKEEGVANINDTMESYQERLMNFEKVAKYTNELYKSLDLRLSGETNEDGSRKYSADVIDKLVYASAKITNYDLRIPQVNAALDQAGVPTIDVLTSIIKDGRPNKTATKEALKQINDLDVVSEVKDELKTALSDVIEMSLRRKLYMKEYDAIKADPTKTELESDEAMADTKARIKQQIETEEGKKKTVGVDLEVGKEYSLIQPSRRDGNTLQLAPKLTILSKTLGGEYEVKTPSGQVTFMKPEEFKQYQLSSVDNKSEALDNIMNDAIDAVLANPKFADVVIPEGADKLATVNGLDNKELTDAIEAEFNKRSADYMQNLKEEVAKKEKVQKIADKVKKFQDNVEKDSGDNPTDEPVLDDEVSTSKVTANKIFTRLFTSTTSPNGDREVLAPHLVRYNQFLNNAKNFKNRGKLQVILFTQKQEAALGLTGVIDLSYNGKIPANINDLTKGFVGAVFVQVGKDGSQSFVDADGNVIGKVGEQVDLSKVVFSAMPTAELYTESASGERTNRFREGEEAQAKEARAAWEEYRKGLFEGPANAKFRYGFQISRGVANINKEAPEKNSVGDTIVPTGKIAKQEGLVQVPTTGTISHEDGENYKFPNGCPVLVYSDVLQFLNNNLLNKKQAYVVYQLFKELSDVVNSATSSDKPITFDPKKQFFLQNVLYWGKKGNASPNKVFINDETGDLHIGEKTYDMANLAKFENEIMEQLQTVYHNVNNRTLKAGLAQPFYEYMSNGQVRTWKNYQEYLLSADGRKLEDVPLTTSVSKPSPAVPYAFKNKYAFLEGLDLGYETVAPKAQATQATPGEYSFDGETNNVYPSVSGPVNFVATKNEQGEPVVTVTGDNPTVSAVAADPAKLKTITDVMIAQNLYDDLATAEETVASFYANQISGSIIKSQQAAPEVKETKPRGGRQQPRYKRVGPFGAKAISPIDMEAFKEWAAEKLPTMPYEFLDNMIRTYDGKAAWGVLEKGVAKIFKGAGRGTEYHEAFHFVFRGFLSPAQQQELFDEFRSKTGSFLDTASGKMIDYADATDLQAEERIADDFADFRLGKLPARSLTESIKRFFKAIMDFFKSFVNKPSLKDELFAAIETGEFKERSYPEEIKDKTSAYKEVPGLTASMVNDFVQDITANVFTQVFGDNKSLFDISNITSKELFDKVREDLSEEEYYADLSDETWNQLVDKTKLFLKTYNIEFDEDSRVTINDESSDRNSYAAETFSVDFKKSSPYAVKLLVGTLIQTKKMNQTFSTSLKLPDYAESSIDGFKLVPYGTAFSTLLNKLENTKDVNQFVDKLFDLAKEKSEYVRLFKRLGGNLDTGKIDFRSYNADDWRLFVNFFQVFTKQKPEAIKQFRDGLQIYSGSANQATTSKQLQDEWIENMIALAAKPESMITRDQKTRSYKVDKEEIAVTPIRNKGEMVYFLEKLGINFPMVAYSRLRGSQIKEFADAVASIKMGITKSEGKILSLKGKTLDIGKGLSTLASLYTSVNSTNINTTFYNSEGKQQQEFTDNNAPSYFEHVFNSATSIDDLMAKMPQLQDVFSTNSQILKKGGLFFDEDGDRIDGADLKVQFLVGDENKLTGEGKSIASLSIGDRMTTEINQNLDGNYYVLIPADGSTEWMMNLGNQVGFVQFAVGEGMADVHAIFQEYLKDEIALAQDASNRPKLDNVGAKAKELRFFKEILSGKLLEGVNGLISSNAGVTEIDEFLDNEVKEGQKTNRELVNDAVSEFIDGTVAKTKQLLIENSQLFNSKNGNYIYPNLDTAFANSAGLFKDNMTETDLNNLLTFANANFVINNIEYHKILFGDPYQFKIDKGQLDETKRIKSFLSPRRFTFNTPEYNTFLNENMNQVAGVNLEYNEDRKDYGFHQFKDYLKTFTAKDIKIVGKLSELFPAYANVDEADASSWISPTAYREVKIKNGQWSDEAEAFHQWQMAYTRQNIAGYEYASKALEAHDKELVNKPMPKYFIEVLKPIVSGNKFNKNNIDLVLDKDSQVPLYYQAVKGTNLESLFDKMFKEGYDYAIVKSGRKVGSEGLHNLYNADGSFNEEVFNNTVDVPWTSYGIQVENSYEKDKLQTRGSQLTKLATLDLYSNGQAISPEIDSEVKNNTDLLNKLTVAGYNEMLNKLGIRDLGDSYAITDNTAVAETLRQQMLSQQLSENAIDSISLDETTGQFIVPFEASTNYIQIKNILYSVVNKTIISPKMGGFPGVQISAAMWEDSTKGRQLVMKNDEGVWENISKEQYESLDDSEKKDVKFTSSALKFYENKEGERYCEVLLPNWMRDQFKGEKYDTDEKIMNYLNTDEGKKILSGIGFRIPTQALSSVEVFRVKGFLPAFMGRSVVVPSEITVKAGSDFDIDKLNMYLKSVYTDVNGDVRLIEYKGSEEATKEFYAKQFDLLSASEQGYILREMNRIGLEEEDFDREQELIEQQEKLNVSKEVYVNKMYKKALENAYYESLEKLLTLPENFDRLVNPNTDATLKALSSKINKLEGIDETTVKNRLLDRNYMTQLRQSFITAKKWVGRAAVNITGNSLVQKDEIYFRFGTTFLPHNTITINGEERITLSNNKDQDVKGGKYISDKLSEYANAFVDVAKDPYILDIIYSNSVVDSFLLLERIGVPTETTALFMNQPIIKKYIKFLDSTNQKSSALTNKKNLNIINSLFPASTKDIADAAQAIDVKAFEDNITAYSQGKQSDKFNATQRVILNEFLKINAMAQASFDLTQAINYDTTTFRNADELDRKQLKTELVEKEGMLSSPSKILASSPIGEQKNYLDKSTEALGAILKFNSNEFRGVIKDAIRAYAQSKYLSNDKFNKIAEKLSASFLDYIIGIKGNINVKELTVDADSVANRVVEAKSKYPDVKILQELVVVTGSEEEGAAKTVRLKGNIKDAYEENLHISYMNEMRNHPSQEVRDLYKDLVRLSIVQGTFRSNVSIKNIVPLQDYADIVAPIINNLVVDEDVRNFAKLAMFERNNWKDDDVVPNLIPTYWGGIRNKEGKVVALSYGQDHYEIGFDAAGTEVYQYYSPTFLSDGTLRVYGYSSGAGANVVKINRIIRRPKQGDMIDFVTGRTVTPAIYRELKEKLGTEIDKVWGYQRIDENGEPVMEIDDKGNPYYFYKAINLLGDGKIASEYMLFPTPSVINNNTEVVDNEYNDDVIVTENDLAEKVIELKDGVAYNYSDINSGMLEALGYSPEEIGQILKSIC